MPVSPNEIRDACAEFIALIHDTGASVEERVQQLRRVLDRLALIQHDVDDTFDGADYSEPPEKDYDALRKLVSSRFPNFGYYNVPIWVTREIGTSNMGIGDAIDDIVDIAADLRGVLWRFDHASSDDALWYFKFSYAAHWEEHLRDLQVYLQRLADGYEGAA